MDGYKVTISKTIRSHKGIFTIKRCIFHQQGYKIHSVYERKRDGKSM